jgi:hypothetical protein
VPALYTQFNSGSLENGANEAGFPMIISVVRVEEVSVRGVFREKEENRYPFARRTFCDDF